MVVSGELLAAVDAIGSEVVEIDSVVEIGMVVDNNATEDGVIETELIGAEVVGNSVVGAIVTGD